MAFVLDRGGIAQNIRQQPHRGIQHGLGGYFPPCHDKIAQRDLGDLVMVQHPLIDAFKAAAQQRDAICPGPVARHGLIKACPARGQIDHRPVFGRSAAGVINGGAQYIGAQHHASAAARRRVVNVFMPALTKAAQIGCLKRPFAVF